MKRKVVFNDKEYQVLSLKSKQIEDCINELYKFIGLPAPKIIVAESATDFRMLDTSIIAVSKTDGININLDINGRKYEVSNPGKNVTNKLHGRAQSKEREIAGKFSHRKYLFAAINELGNFNSRLGICRLGEPLSTYCGYSGISKGSNALYSLNQAIFYIKELDVEIKKSKSSVDLGIDPKKLCPIISSGVILKEKLAVLCELPEEVHTNNRITSSFFPFHNPKGPAFKDKDQEAYFWKGTRLDRKFIMDKGALTAADLITKNAERRRTYIEVIGPAEYFSKVGTSGLKCIDTAVDKQGKEMKLHQYTYNSREVKVCELVCPSTDRVYFIFPTDQRTNDVWTAKASILGITKEECMKLKNET